jgi:hypothetical protein
VVRSEKTRTALGAVATDLVEQHARVGSESGKHNAQVRVYLDDFLQRALVLQLLGGLLLDSQHHHVASLHPNRRRPCASP